MKSTNKRNKINPSRPNRARRKSNATRRVTVPSAISQQVTNRGALRTLTLSHKEYIKDIEFLASYDTQHLSTLEVNPGLVQTFPWLSALATRFETYQFTKLKFCFIPMVGTNTVGAIAISPDYDPADDNTSGTKSKIMSFEDCKRGPLWMPLVMQCSAKNIRKQKSYYSRYKPLDANLDIKMYDPLKLNLLVNHEPQDTVLGELWVEYTIVLQTPQMNVSPTYSVNLQNEINPLSTPGFFTNPTIVGDNAPVVVETDQRLGIKRALPFLYHLSYNLYTDGNPQQTLSSFGTNVVRKLIRASLRHEGDDFYTYQETGAMLASDECENAPSGDGENMVFTRPTITGWVDPEPYALFDTVISPLSSKVFHGLTSALPSDVKLKDVVLKPGDNIILKREKKELKTKKKEVIDAKNLTGGFSFGKNLDSGYFKQMREKTGTNSPLKMGRGSYHS